MKKVIAWLLVLVLTAAVSIGATLAYLTDTDEDVNVMTLGKVKIDQLEYERIDTETENEEAKVQEFRDNKPLLPTVVEDKFDWTTGDSYVNWDQIGSEGSDLIWDPEKINNEVDKMVFVKNKGDYDAYIRSVIAFEAGNYTTLEQFLSKVHLNINTEDYDWEWVEAPQTIGEGKYFVATATYKGILAPGKLTPPSLLQIALDPSATNEDVEAFGDTYQVLVKSQGIQADGFDTAVLALNDGFYAISASNIPWETDSPVKGIDMRTALHNYMGDTTQVITAKVSNVIYGLKKEYPQIVNNYDSVLMDEEQDVPVRVYYVPNGSNYDVYFLASGTIYTPADCRTLFAYMTSLVSIDTRNLDVSRTTNMRRMFRGSNKLPTLDTSEWDTSKVTTMNGMFYQCYALEALDVSGWDVSKVTDMAHMFRDCQKLQTLDVSEWDVGSNTDFTATFVNDYVLSGLDVSGWDTSNVTSMNTMFAYCYKLDTLDVSDWKTGKVTTFEGMFQGNQNRGNMSIKELDVSNWDTSSCTTMNHMFYSCGQLTELDMSNWDVSKVTTFSHMFADCYKMKNFNFTGWDTSSCISLNAMFNNCESVEYLDVSSFDTALVYDFGQCFEACSSLKQLVGLTNWDTAKSESFFEMFTGTQLTELDLSSFDCSKVYLWSSAFQGNGKLKTIYVSEKWQVGDYITGSVGMFTGCGSLVGGAGTTFMGSDLKYAKVDGGPQDPGYLTLKTVTE